MIRVEHVSKQYEKAERKALNDISFELGDGEMLGLIGQNGAGKSTLLKILCKFIRADEGDVFVDGESILHRDNSLSRVGILLEPVYFPYLSAWENLAFYLNVHGRPSELSEIDPMLELVGLQKNRDQKPTEFSFGMKQRLGLAQALLGKPRVLVLDEPFVGLDPTGVKELIGILKKKVAEEGMQAIISSHQLYELNEVCERMLVLYNGELVFDGIPAFVPEITLDLDHPYEGELGERYPVTVENGGMRIIVAESDPDQMLKEVLAHYRIKNVASRGSALERFFEEERS
ncbi:MAG: ABC transporter ATP-binding protein [Lachnospiraceae bacterium]|nr:ABC transporter ATP-binding protein [Lachnospiraceae bacterium]